MKAEGRVVTQYNTELCVSAVAKVQINCQVWVREAEPIRLREEKC